MKTAVFALLAFGSSAAGACPKCRPFVEAGIFNASFGSNLVALALPLALVGAIGAALYFAESLIARMGIR